MALIRLGWGWWPCLEWSPCLEKSMSESEKYVNPSMVINWHMVHTMNVSSENDSPPKILITIKCVEFG